MRKKIDLLLLALVLIAGAIAVPNAQSIGDWWHFRNYQASKQIQQIAEDAGMNERGQRLFYRFSPQLISEQEMSDLCGQKLGCTQGRSIYILEPDGTVEYNRAVVTAAHEMLHVAYSRLSAEELEDLENMLLEQIKEEPQSLATKLKGYDTSDYIPEAHSFIGSESAPISQELENYYSRYFEDRSKSVNAYRWSPEG